jgi:hypothetical protein
LNLVYVYNLGENSIENGNKNLVILAFLFPLSAGVGSLLTIPIFRRIVSRRKVF